MRLPLPLPSPETDKTWGFVQLSYTIGKPHRIARATDSSFILPENFSLSDKELKDIDLAYDLLKGERRKIQTGVFEFEPTIEIDIIDNQDLLCTTLLSINILDQLLCEIPACIELYGYQLEEVPDSKNLRLVQGDSGTAWMSYAENLEVAPEEGWIAKKTSTLEPK